MNQHLMQAIAAARAGKKPQAKVLLARVIKDEPENVNAWFLLSSLADTEEQKIQHLQKVLELQPGHPAAAEQLAELVPPEPVEEALPDGISDTMEFTYEAEPGPAAEVSPLPETAPVNEAPDDPDEAMAWLEQLAADQGASLDELPTLFDGEAPDETAAEVEEDYSWLEEDIFESNDYLGAMPTVVDEQPEEAPEDEKPAKTLAISNDFDFVSQSKGDSIPAWLAGEEGFIAADTVITGAVEPEVVEQPEPENLPDWLNDESLDDWMGEEGEKSGQVVWKAGEGDESLKPTAPGAKKETKTKTKTAARKTAAAGNNTNLYLALLIFIAIVLIVAILYILVTQPL